MKQRHDGIGLTYQEGKGFKKCIGWYEHADGQRRPKIHWLGHDRDHAQYLAFSLTKAWQVMQANGPRGWTPQDIANVKAFIAEGADLMAVAMRQVAEQRRQLDEREALIRQASFTAPGPAAVEVAPTPAPAEEKKPASLYGAVEAFLAAVKARPVSESHKERTTQILEINLKQARQDCPLSDVDYVWLEALANYFRSRPASLKEDGKQISAATAALILRYLKTFFVWLDDSGWGGWQGPRKLMKLFRCSAPDLMTPAELRKAATIKQFDLVTLKDIYAAGNKFARRCMLMALFTGATQQELAVLEKSEFDLDGAELFHFRNKTRVEGRYWLPPELVDLLRADFAKRPGDKLAFRTQDGNAMVTFKEGRKTSDAVRQAWDDIREQIDRPIHSFKFLRKYLADWMTRNGGETMGQIALSHSRKTVLAKNYTSARDFEQFKKLQKKMHAELKAAGMFKIGTKVKVAA